MSDDKIEEDVIQKIKEELQKIERSRKSDNSQYEKPISAQQDSQSLNQTPIVQQQ